jgi:ABC-type multidrug transport system ATPase subunit
MIELVNYSKKYNKSLIAVSPLNLHFGQGETFALLGPNGSGKTTILKSIAGLTIPSTGTIKINGIDLQKYPEKTKANISFLPQRLDLPHNLKVIEVLKFFSNIKKCPPERIDELLSQMDIVGSLNQQVGELSGGMLQRLGLIITLLKDTAVYIFDEPTLNLDLMGLRQFQDYLEKLRNNGKTVILSSHSSSDIEKYTDRIGILVKGKMKIEKTREEFNHWISGKTQVILAFNRRINSLIDVAIDNGASHAEYDDEYFRYQADYADQMKVMNAIREQGIEILSVAFEKPSLDQLVGGNNV